MARSSYSVTLGQSLGEGRYNTSTKGVPDLVTAAAALNTTTVASTLATLVADGASPTQAHVTAVNNAWTTLLALIVSAKAAGLGDASVSIDNAVLTSTNARRAAIQALLRSLDADGSLTA